MLPLLLTLGEACSDNPTTPSSAISLSSTTLTFPQTAIGDTATASVTLSTTSAETIGLSDTDTADFPYQTTCAPSLPAGASCSITVQFHPNTPGTMSAWLAVNSLSGTKTSMELTGTAVGTPALNNAGSSIDLLEIVTAEPNPFSLSPGQTTQLAASAILSGGGAQDVTSVATWTSSDPTVVTVSQGGLVTAIGQGNASVTVVYVGHVASIRVFVTSASST